MKHLKMSIVLLLTVAIFTSCEKETMALPENAEMNMPQSEANKQSTSQHKEYAGVEFFYESEDVFNLPCDNLPTEDFSNQEYYGSYSPEDILTGISFESLYGRNIAYNRENKALLAQSPNNDNNFGDADLIINFTGTNVHNVSMKIGQQWTSQNNINMNIAIYGLSENLIGTSIISANYFILKNWGVSSSEPIKQIILTGYFPLIDDVSFGNCDLDADDDGILDENDPFPYSNFSETISIGGNDLNIDNVLTGNGTTMMDQIDALIAEINAQYNGDNYYYLHKRFMTKLSAITYYWIKDRLITSKQRSKISSAAWSADIPYFNQPD
jgi:hypothetical protein